MVKCERGKNWISCYLRTHTFPGRLLNPLPQIAIYPVLYHRQMFYDSSGRPAPGSGRLLPQCGRHFLKSKAKSIELRIEVVKQLLGTWMKRPVTGRDGNSMI